MQADGRCDQLGHATTTPAQHPRTSTWTLARSTLLSTSTRPGRLRTSYKSMTTDPRQWGCPLWSAWSTLATAEFVVMTVRPVAAEQQRGVVVPGSELPLPTKPSAFGNHRATRGYLRAADHGCAPPGGRRPHGHAVV